MQLLQANRLALLSLVASTSALQTAVPQVPRDARESTGQFCAAEPRNFSDQDLPQVPPASLLSRVRTAEELRREELLVAEYTQNLSHVRYCATALDVTPTHQALIVPELKLAFCYIPKVACTQFKDLFNRLNKLPSPEGFARSYWSSMPKSLGFPLESISRENGWKFATFTRDPALRYLSAWGSTCVSKSKSPLFEHPRECCGPLVYDNTIDPDAIVSMFEARAMSDLRDGVAAQEIHWVAQVQMLKQCGWDLFKPNNLDFYGQLHLDMNTQVKDMLKMVNHSDDALVDRLFPPNGDVAGHTSPLRHLSPEDAYRNRQTLEAVKRIYEDDYQAFPDIGCSFTEPRLALLREWGNSSAAGSV